MEKKNKIKNLLDYNTFGEIEDRGLKTIGSRWVITQKEKHNGQMQYTKGRLVAQDSFKMLMAVAANSGFKLASVDIRAAFLQSKVLDREVFMKPPDDIRKTEVIWRLKKPL